MQSQLAPKPKRASNPSSRRHSILIIEDDASMAEVLAMRLTTQGYRTWTAHRGDEGVSLARSEHPDLVLLDLRLPDGDGLQVCAVLDESPETTGTPIIVLSGMERPDVIRRSRAAGCRYYVRKPYDPNALLLLIQQAIRECSESSW